MEAFTKPELKALKDFIRDHATIGDMQQRIGWISQKIDLLALVDGEYDMGTGYIDFKIRFDADSYVKVLKTIREDTGFGLREAKDIVDLGFDRTKLQSELTFKNSTIEFYNRFLQYCDKGIHLSPVHVNL